MSNEFIEIKYPHGNPWYDCWGTHCKFNKPTTERKYIKILAQCLSYATASVIYPNVDHPLTHQLHDLWKNGYLKKFKRVGDRRIYYKTTNSGQELIMKALEAK